jgi:hypothetical protein
VEGIALVNTSDRSSYEYQYIQKWGIRFYTSIKAIMRPLRSFVFLVWLGGAFLKETNAFLVSLAPITTHRSITTTTTTSLQAGIEYDDFLPNPHPDLSATDVVAICMNTLVERKDGGGLEVCFHFSSDTCRAAVGGSLDNFADYANNPVFGFLVKCSDWKTISVGSMITGTPIRGAMQTVLTDAIQPAESTKPGDDPARRFLWTLQQERRPPRQGYWVVHSVVYVKNAFQLLL